MINKVTSAGKRYFIYAPPLKGVRESKRKPPKPPYPNAPSWKCSVYYYWWEFLRRNDGYKQTCDNDGQGRYAKLYTDFGDVHKTEFWVWWRTHQHLFSEPLPPQVRLLEGDEQKHLPNNMVCLAIPLNQRLSVSMRRIRYLLKDKVSVPARSKSKSQAQYPVHTKPVLSGLHACLTMLDAYRKYPHMPLYLIKDYADGSASDADMELFRKTTDRAIKNKIGGDFLLRRSKTLFAGRAIRYAQEYVVNVGKGQFPKFK